MSESVPPPPPPLTRSDRWLVPMPVQCSSIKLIDYDAIQSTKASQYPLLPGPLVGTVPAMPYVGMSPSERQNSAVELSTMLCAAEESAASLCRSWAASSASRRSVDRAAPPADSDSCRVTGESEESHGPDSHRGRKANQISGIPLALTSGG